jgi:hypothetical protein
MLSREVFMAVSDHDGAFMFDDLAIGTYVLHIEGQTTGRVYDPANLLIKISPDSKITAVAFKRSGPSNCGGTSLMPSWID